MGLPAAATVASSALPTAIAGPVGTGLSILSMANQAQQLLGPQSPLVKGDLFGAAKDIGSLYNGAQGLFASSKNTLPVPEALGRQHGELQAETFANLPSSIQEDIIKALLKG